MSCLVDSNTELPFHPDICRLCVEKEQILWNIFEVCDSEGINLKLPEKIIALLDIMVEINDGLPDQICSKCMTAVRSFYEFRQQCREHDSMLRNSLSALNEHNSPKPVISDPKHLERKEKCPAEKHFETSPYRQIEHHDTQLEVLQTSGYSPCRGEETSKTLSDNNMDITVAEQLQEEWDQDDDCEVDGTQTDLKKSELPWRLNAEILSENKIEEKNLAEAKALDSNRNVNPSFVLDRVNFSTMYGSNPVSEHSENMNPHESTANFCGSVIVLRIENLEADLQSANTETIDKGDLLDPQHVEASEEMFAGRISRNQLGFWVCNICNQEYNKLLDLKCHVARHYSYCENQCSECQIFFESPEELNCHKTLHITSSLVLGHACHQCYKSFRRKHLLEKHVALEHTSSDTRKTIPKKFRVTCGKCVRVFYSSVEMEDHDESCNEGVIESAEDSPEESDHSTTVNTVPRKNNSRRRGCYLCKLDFDSMEQLKFHFTEVHKSDKPLKCDRIGCEKVFQKMSQFWDHKKRSHGRNFTCEHCQKAYVDKLRLLCHIRQHHLNERPFKCSTCDKGFASNQKLRWHMHNHTKKYKCDTCGARFGSHYNLTRHQTTHTDEKRYICEHCGERYSYLEGLKYHYKGRSKNFECVVCGIIFCTEHKLKVHNHQHTKKRLYTCKLCGVQYSHIASLDTHKKKKHSSDTSLDTQKKRKHSSNTSLDTQKKKNHSSDTSLDTQKKKHSSDTL